MARPRIGVLLPNTGRGAGPAAIREFARLAEDAGVDSLWVGDHVVLSAAQETEYPYADASEATYEVPADFPFLEAFTTLGFAAAVTERCRLGLGVGILPYRHPLLWAKLAGTVQVLSGGRFDFGVGTGWLREEFDALDAPFEDRGAVSNEMLEIVHRLRESPAESLSFEGEHFSVDRAWVNPSTGGPSPPPIWVGGSTKPAERRAARFADVWYPHVYGMEPSHMRSRLDALRERAAGLGRDVDLRGSLYAPLELAPEPGGEPWETGTIAGPPAFVAEVLERYREAGIDHVTLTFGGGPERRLGVIEQVFEACG